MNEIGRFYDCCAFFEYLVVVLATKTPLPCDLSVLSYDVSFFMFVFLVVVLFFICSLSVWKRVVVLNTNISTYFYHVVNLLHFWIHSPGCMDLIHWTLWTFDPLNMVNIWSIESVDDYCFANQYVHHGTVSFTSIQHGQVVQVSHNCLFQIFYKKRLISTICWLRQLTVLLKRQLHFRGAN